MKQVIARIRLNPGKGGYFDPVTRVHLTHGEPECNVYAGMNTANLKKAVRDKRIKLVSGSLGNFEAPFKLVKNADGKVVLMLNNVQKSTPAIENKKDKKATAKEAKKEVVAEALATELKETVAPVKEVTDTAPTVERTETEKPVQVETVKEDAEDEAKKEAVKEAESKEDKAEEAAENEETKKASRRKKKK